MNHPGTRPRPSHLALIALVLVGLAAAQAAFEILRGEGILRQPAFLAGLMLAIGVGMGLLVWLARRQDAVDAALKRAADRPLGWLQRQTGLALALCILCLLVLPAWMLSGWQVEHQTPLSRLALFWLLSLGAASIAPIAGGRRWAFRWGMTALIMGTIYQISTFVPHVSSDPFSLGWSEASRYYYASLFLAGRLYGEWFPLPILHPTRYLLQAAPFLIPGTPIWVHRVWQVILWLGMTYTGAWLLSRRVAWARPDLKRWAVLWLALFFFQGAVYYHLMLSVILILAAFDPRHTWRSLVVVVLASIWSGISRVNWIPVPGMLAVALYALERPQGSSEGFVGYWIRPAVWAVAGAAAGFAGQAAYVSWSGNPATDFGTAFSSDLLWYRLLPNPTFPLGVLPAIALAVLPLALVCGFAFRARDVRLGGWRLASLGVLLGVLLGGGVIVSVKIGGGGDLHNFDAFLVMLAVCGTYLGFDRRLRPSLQGEDGGWWPWWQLTLLIVMPMVFVLSGGGPVRARDANHEADVLSAIQAAADDVRSTGRPVLFLTERQLLTFDMLDGIALQPEDEKVTLMEMAMGHNQPYLARFHRAIRSQQYGLIVSEPLGVQAQGRSHAFGEENDAWSEEVSVPVLCAYKSVYKSNSPPIQLLVPKDGVDACAP